MKLISKLAVAFLASSVVLGAVNGSPLHGQDLPATRRLVELTARRLGELRGVPLDASGLTCDACKVIVDTLNTLYAENRTWDDIVAVITEVCIELQIEDRNVCTLAIKEFEVIALVHIATPTST